jgi:hypothetical protein
MSHYDRLDTVSINEYIDRLYETHKYHQSKIVLKFLMEYWEKYKLAIDYLSKKIREDTWEERYSQDRY